MNKFDLETPALCIDMEAVGHNLRTMQDFADRAGVDLRPHAKTHKNPFFAHMQIALGAVGVCVAKLSEAAVMVEGGVKDILVTNEIADPRKTAPTGRTSATTPRLRSRWTICPAPRRQRARRWIWAARCIFSSRLIAVRYAAVRPPVSRRWNWHGASWSLKAWCFAGVMGYEGHCMFIEDCDERKQKAHAAQDSLVGTVELLRAHGIPVQTVLCRRYRHLRPYRQLSRHYRVATGFLHLHGWSLPTPTP